MKQTILLVCLCAFFGTGSRLAVANIITAPNNFYVGNGLPFGGVGDGSYQQVYSSSFFTKPISITGLTFYIPGALADQGDTGFASGNYVVSLSTTPVSVGALDPNNMLGNFGTDNQVFFSGALDGGSSIAGTPFNYDPSQGNLLMTVNVSNRALTWGIPGPDIYDGGFYRSDNDIGTSRAYNFPAWSSAGSDTSGLATSFIYASVPEPTTLALIGLGFAGFIVTSKRKVGGLDFVQRAQTNSCRL